MLEVDPYGWENYRSAESDLEVCAAILRRWSKKPGHYPSRPRTPSANI
jgi:hypothetical protein